MKSSHSNSQLLLELIRDRVTASPQQRLTFSEYMDLVLYHPQYGYYSSGIAQIGAEGDFFTASSLGSDFGELLAEQFIQMWEILGRPDRFTLLEMGAGQGVLAKDIANYLATHHPQFWDCVEYPIFEQAPSLIQRQQEALRSEVNRDGKISWKQWDDLADNSIVGCCFSNELVDAFPVHLVSIDRGELQEIYIAQKEGRLIEVKGEISTLQLKKYFELVDINLLADAYPNGYRTEVNLAALSWLETIARKLKRGYSIAIDYGYTAQRYYHPQRNGGTLQCYYQHRHHNNPYVNLGLQDITAHVNFTALEQYGKCCGLQHIGLTKQGLFLMALGAGDRLTALANSELSIQQVIHRRDALHQLIDPAGLGGFQVLVQSKGLGENEAAQPLKGLSFPS